MYKKENSAILRLYGVTPLHAGSGNSFGVVDSPIQRERHTNWPHVQASGVKGAMRHFFQDVVDEKTTQLIFGADNFDGSILPGAISVSDAKLLAYPIRSSHRPFVWVTCPAVITRLINDLNLVGKVVNDISVKPSGNTAYIVNGKLSGKILLEDYEVNVEASNVSLPEEISKLLDKAQTCLLVSDEMYHYAVSNCTEIQAQIAINHETGATKDGSLRYQEVLPSDSILYTVLFWGDVKHESEKVQVKESLKTAFSSHIQIGGDETLGRGFFEVKWF